MRWDFGSSRGTANSFRRGKVSGEAADAVRWRKSRSLDGIRFERHIERLILRVRNIDHYLENRSG